MVLKPAGESPVLRLAWPSWPWEAGCGRRAERGADSAGESGQQALGWVDAKAPPRVGTSCAVFRRSNLKQVWLGARRQSNWCSADCLQSLTWRRKKASPLNKRRRNSGACWAGTSIHDLWFVRRLTCLQAHDLAARRGPASRAAPSSGRQTAGSRRHRGGRRRGHDFSAVAAVETISGLVASMNLTLFSVRWTCNHEEIAGSVLAVSAFRGRGPRLAPTASWPRRLAVNSWVADAIPERL